MVSYTSVDTSPVFAPTWVHTMNRDDIDEHVTVKRVQPEGAATYDLTGIEDLIGELKEDTDYSVNTRRVVKAVGQMLFDEDYPLLKAHNCTCVVEEGGLTDTYEYRVALIHNASSSVRDRDARHE